MTYTRWYDKDKYLKLLLNTLEHLDDHTNIQVAIDLIQMIIHEKGSDADFLIEKLGSDYNPGKRRWYDKEENVKSAVEMLKHIDTAERSAIINEILYSILQYKKDERLKSNNE